MSKFTKIDNLLMADKVYKELKNAILKRILEPGQKLDIFELAEQFNVSRTPVKEAFNRLHLEGLLVIKPRKGTYVAEIDLEKILEIFDARLLFETWAVQIGVLQAKDEDTQVLRRLCEEMDIYYNAETFDYIRYNELDEQFHYHIVKMAGNQSILNLYKSLNAHRFTERAYYEIAYERAQSTHAQHHAIVEAFEKREVNLVLSQITNHIVTGKEKLVDYLLKK